MHFTKIFLDLVNMTQRNYKLYSKKRLCFLTYCNLRITLKNIWLTLILYIITNLLFNVFSIICSCQCANPNILDKKNGKVKSYSKLYKLFYLISYFSRGIIQYMVFAICNIWLFCVPNAWNSYIIPNSKSFVNTFLKFF